MSLLVAFALGLAPIAAMLGLIVAAGWFARAQTADGSTVAPITPLYRLGLVGAAVVWIAAASYWNAFQEAAVIYCAAFVISFGLSRMAKVKGAFAAGAEFTEYAPRFARVAIGFSLAVLLYTLSQGVPQ